MERIRGYNSNSIFRGRNEKNGRSDWCVFEGMKIDCVIPVDIFKVTTDMGFNVRGAEFEKNLEGLIIVNENIEKIEGSDSNKIIVYNCFKDINIKKLLLHMSWHIILVKKQMRMIKK